MRKLKPLLSSYGRWAVIGKQRGRDQYIRVLCRCSCGAERSVLTKSLRGGFSTKCRDCADKSRPPGNLRHGASRFGRLSPEYISWRGILQRCADPNCKAWKYYGGRGIKVSRLWRHDFAAFLAHVGKRPSRKHSIDRINNDRGYFPGNVRWATAVQQANNRRPQSTR